MQNECEKEAVLLHRRMQRAVREEGRAVLRFGH